MLPAAASSSPKHAWTGCSFKSRPFHFILVYWCCLRTIRWVISSFCLPRFKWRAWTIIARAQRYGDRRKGAASNWAEHIGRDWSNTVPSDIRRTSWRLTVWFARMKHAWGAETKGHKLLIFFSRGTRQFNERYDSVSAKGTWNRPRWPHNFRRNVACWAKIECASYTKLMPASWKYKNMAVVSLQWMWSKSGLLSYSLQPPNILPKKEDKRRRGRRYGKKDTNIT